MSLPQRTLPMSAMKIGTHKPTPSRISRLDLLLRSRAAALGFDLHAKPTIVVGVPCLGILVIGAKTAGPAGSVGAFAALVLLEVGSRRLAVHRQRIQIERALPDVSLRLARGLRSGQPIDRVLVEVAEGTASPSGLVVAGRQLASGRSIIAALDEWTTTAESSAERLLAAALVIGIRWGGDVAAAVDLVGDGIRDDLELAARRRVLLVQATMSASVLVAMPLCFALVASVVRGGLVFTGALGIALVVGGLTLDLLGCLWMRALMRSLR